MKAIDPLLAEACIGPRCTQRGAQVERPALSGPGLSRPLDIQAYQYALASCHTCGHMEIYNPRIPTDRDDPGPHWKSCSRIDPLAERFHVKPGQHTPQTS